MNAKRHSGLKVVKFGGTSLADGAQIRKVLAVVRADPERRIVVVSAPGRRHEKDAKVTDLLIACGERRLAGGDAAAERAAVVERFAVIRSELGLPAAGLADIEADLAARLAADPSHPGRFLDRMKAAGEDHTARLVAEALRAEGAEAAYVSPVSAGLVLSPEPGNAVVRPESYRALKALRTRRGITVFPGFFGVSAAGDVVTFPRGGSDITGAVLAAAVDADLYENFTDVDSVFAVDPRLVKDARPIELLTFHEMRELAYAGFAVFHDEAIVPVVEAGIPVCIRNTNRPGAPGTTLAPARDYSAGGVVGIAGSDGFCTVFVSKYLMNRQVGFGRRLLQIVEEEGLAYEHAPSGIDNTSLILRERDLTPEREARILERIRDELAPDDVSVERGLALIMIVGEGMRYTVGMAAKATGALAAAGVNIEMMNQGSSEISMMFGVKAVDRKRAVQALYEAFFERGRA